MQIFKRKLFLIAALFFTSNAFASDLIQEKLPAFSIPTLNGKTLTNKQFCGHTTILNFWASWCYACKDEHAILLKIKQTDHIAIYGVNLEDSAENATQWIKKAGNPFTEIGLDPDGALGNLFGVTVLPKTFVIDANGDVRYVYSGGLTDETYEQFLAPVIAQVKTIPMKKNSAC